MKISVFEDDEKLGNALASELFDGINYAYNSSKPYVLGCPGGRSPRSTYKALGRLIAANQLSIRHLSIAMMDEYVTQSAQGVFSNVDSSLHFSCKRFAHEEIRNVLNAGIPERLQIPFDHVLLPDAENPQGYEILLTSLGIDCFLLASGATDGHVAFNGIGASREAITRVTPLSVETRTDNLQTFTQFSSLEEVPHFGVTVGPSTITSLSKSAIMILQGFHKRNAFQKISTSDSYSPDWPATIVSECKNPQIFADLSASKA